MNNDSKTINWLYVEMTYPKSQDDQVRMGPGDLGLISIAYLGIQPSDVDTAAQLSSNGINFSKQKKEGYERFHIDDDLRGFKSFLDVYAPSEGELQIKEVIGVMTGNPHVKIYINRSRPCSISDNRSQDSEGLTKIPMDKDRFYYTLASQLASAGVSPMDQEGFDIALKKYDISDKLKLGISFVMHDFLHEC